MSGFLHIDLPCDDGGIAEIEKALGIKFKSVEPILVSNEMVDVCPMPAPDGKIYEQT